MGQKSIGFVRVKIETLVGGQASYALQIVEPTFDLKGMDPIFFFSKARRHQCILLWIKAGWQASSDSKGSTSGGVPLVRHNGAIIFQHNCMVWSKFSTSSLNHF